MTTVEIITEDTNIGKRNAELRNAEELNTVELKHELTVADYPLAHRERTDGLTLLAFYHLGWGGLYLVGACLTAIPTGITAIVGLVDSPDLFFVSAILAVATFFIFGLALLYLLVGYGLWTLRQWARTAALALGLISLPTGLGTIPGAVTIWYLLKEEISALFR